MGEIFKDYSVTCRPSKNIYTNTSAFQREDQEEASTAVARTAFTDVYPLNDKNKTHDMWIRWTFLFLYT